MSAEGTLARRSQNDATWVRVTLTTAAVLVIGVLVLIPLVNVFAQALSEGVGVYRTTCSTTTTRSRRSS